MGVASSRFAVAVHTLAVLGYLHDQGEERVSSLLIARSVNTNPAVIRKLLLVLKAAGLVVAKEGKDGGAALARPVSRISLAEIYSAVEENGLLGRNRNPECKACPVSRGMKRVLPTVFDEVDRAVIRTLRGKTLQSVIRQINFSS